MENIIVQRIHCPHCNHLLFEEPWIPLNGEVTRPPPSDRSSWDDGASPARFYEIYMVELDRTVRRQENRAVSAIHRHETLGNLVDGEAIREAFFRSLRVELPKHVYEERPRVLEGYTVAQFGVLVAAREDEGYTTVLTVRPGIASIGMVRFTKALLDVIVAIQLPSAISVTKAGLSIAEIFGSMTNRRAIDSQDANTLAALVSVCRLDDQVSTIEVVAALKGVTMSQARTDVHLIDETIDRLERLQRMNLVQLIVAPETNWGISPAEMDYRQAQDQSPHTFPVDREFGIWGLLEKWVPFRRST